MASAVGLSVRSAPTRGSNLKFLRVLRTLRLIKLLKLVSGSRLWQRWQMEHSINYGMLNIVGAVIKVVLFAHWVACLWGLQASVYHDLGSTWVAVDYGCTSAHEDFEDCFGDAGYARPYLRALYFAVTTITSVGYGDVTANANNEMELMTWETRGLELTRQQRHHSPSNHSAITLQSLCNHSAITLQSFELAHEAAGQRHHSPSNHSAITPQLLCNHSAITRTRSRGSRAEAPFACPAAGKSLQTPPLPCALAWRIDVYLTLEPCSAARCTFIILSSSFLWAVTLGTVIGELTSFDADRAAFRMKIDSLNTFMHKK